MKQPTSDAAALERARADLKAAFEDIDRLASGQRELESQLAARFVEVAALTRIAQRAEDERDTAVEAQKLAVRRLRASVLAAFETAPWRWLPARMRASVFAPLVRATGLLDEEWYARQYGDVAARGIDPVRHFIIYGAREGRLPNPDAASADGNSVAEGGEGPGRAKTDR